MIRSKVDLPEPLNRARDLGAGKEAERNIFQNLALGGTTLPTGSSNTRIEPLNLQKEGAITGYGKRRRVSHRMYHSLVLCACVFRFAALPSRLWLLLDIAPSNFLIRICLNGSRCS